MSDSTAANTSAIADYLNTRFSDIPGFSAETNGDKLICTIPNLKIKQDLRETIERSKRMHPASRNFTLPPGLISETTVAPKDQIAKNDVGHVNRVMNAINDDLLISPYSSLRHKSGNTGKDIVRDHYKNAPDGSGNVTLTISVDAEHLRDMATLEAHLSAKLRVNPTTAAVAR